MDKCASMVIHKARRTVAKVVQTNSPYIKCMVKDTSLYLIDKRRIEHLNFVSLQLTLSNELNKYLSQNPEEKLLHTSNKRFRTLKGFQTKRVPILKREIKAYLDTSRYLTLSNYSRKDFQTIVKSWRLNNTFVLRSR